MGERRSEGEREGGMEKDGRERKRGRLTRTVMQASPNKSVIMWSSLVIWSEERELESG